MSRVLLRELLGRYEVTVGDDSAGVTFGDVAEAASHALMLAEQAGEGEPELGPGVTREDLESGRILKRKAFP